MNHFLFEDDLTRSWFLVVLSLTALSRCDKNAFHLSKRAELSTFSLILFYGDSKGNGEYWIDLEKNGNPLKVFCDMTTAGGGWCLITQWKVKAAPFIESPISTRLPNGLQCIITAMEYPENDPRDHNINHSSRSRIVYIGHLPWYNPLYTSLFSPSNLVFSNSWM